MADLYIIATPIGNYQDITLRAIEKLKCVDFIICEHEKEYKRLFSALHIPLKEYILCQRKNEQEAIDLSLELLNENKNGALISDCGTPLFADPGFRLIQAVRNINHNIISLPGPSSLLMAMTLSPFKIDDFYYAQFLPQNNQQREKAIQVLLKRTETIILLETPYRLHNLLTLLVRFCKHRKVFIPFNLTTTEERIIWGTPDFVKKQVSDLGIKKAEFLVMIERKQKR
ncbi:MAG: SAM-dependent methyltransferase [Spirochaetes bacterium]|nr:SAM-dependent methyltransferase [Spirochaetota bacterium]